MDQSNNCSKCGKGFENLSKVRNHYRKEHQDTVIVTFPGIGTRILNTLNLLITDRNNLERINGRFKCPKCTFKSPMPSTIQKHCKKLECKALGTDLELANEPIMTNNPITCDLDTELITIEQQMDNEFTTG